MLECAAVHKSAVYYLKVGKLESEKGCVFFSTLLKTAVDPLPSAQQIGGGARRFERFFNGQLLLEQAEQTQGRWCVKRSARTLPMPRDIAPGKFHWPSPRLYSEALNDRKKTLTLKNWYGRMSGYPQTVKVVDMMTFIVTEPNPTRSLGAYMLEPRLVALVALPVNGDYISEKFGQGKAGNKAGKFVVHKNS